MLTRRSVTALLAATGVLAPPLARPARAQPAERAVSFVKSTAEQLVAIVNSADSRKEKRRKLRQVIDATVDVDDIAHFCLDRFGRLATPEQTRQYLALFDELLVTKITSHLGEYQGVRVTIGLARAVEDTEIVITVVERPDDPTYQVDWVVSTAVGTPLNPPVSSGASPVSGAGLRPDNAHQRRAKRGFTSNQFGRRIAVATRLTLLSDGTPALISRSEQ